MKSMLNKFALAVAALSVSGAAVAAGGAVADEFKWMTFAVFGAIICGFYATDTSCIPV